MVAVLGEVGESILDSPPKHAMYELHGRPIIADSRRSRIDWRNYLADGNVLLNRENKFYTYSELSFNS